MGSQRVENPLAEVWGRGAPHTVFPYLLSMNSRVRRMASTMFSMPVA